VAIHNSRYDFTGYLWGVLSILVLALMLHFFGWQPLFTNRLDRTSRFKRQAVGLSTIVAWMLLTQALAGFAQNIGLYILCGLVVAAVFGTVKLQKVKWLMPAFWSLILVISLWIVFNLGYYTNGARLNFYGGFALVGYTLITSLAEWRVSRGDESAGAVAASVAS